MKLKNIYYPILAGVILSLSSCSSIRDYYKRYEPIWREDMKALGSDTAEPERILKLINKDILEDY